MDLEGLTTSILWKAKVNCKGLCKTSEAPLNHCHKYFSVRLLYGVVVKSGRSVKILVLWSRYRKYHKPKASLYYSSYNSVNFLFADVVCFVLSAGAKGVSKRYISWRNHSNNNTLSSLSQNYFCTPIEACDMKINYPLSESIYSTKRKHIWEHIGLLWNTYNIFIGHCGNYACLQFLIYKKCLDYT